eukprot:m51a1_g10990 hypothetical protein (401) ;mRNA; r:331067-332865
MEISLLDLPSELVALVLSFADLRDFPSISCACHALRALALDNTVWKGVYQRLVPGAANVERAQCPSWREHVRRINALLAPAGVAVARAGPHGSPGMRPSARYKHAAVQVDGKMYVIGGQVMQTVRFDDVWVYDPESKAWSLQRPLFGTAPRFSRFSAVAINGKIYMYGGYDGMSSYFQVQVFDPRERTWSVLQAGGEAAPLNRTNHAACAVGDKMYVFGGISGKRLVDLDDLWAFDTTSASWQRLSAPNRPEARCGHIMFSVGKKIYVFGGGAEEGWKRKFTRLHVYDTEANAWGVQEVTGAVQEVIFPLACKAGEFVFIFGGIGPAETETVTRRLFVLDTVSFHMSEITLGRKNKMDAKAMGTACAIGNSIYFFGGSDCMISAVADFDTLSLPWIENEQ